LQKNIEVHKLPFITALNYYQQSMTIFVSEKRNELQELSAMKLW